MTDFVPHTIIWALGAFILGSIPTGLLIARSRGINIREHGSGNIGATNVRRTLGKKAGAVTFIFDVSKGLFAVLLPTWFSQHPDSIAIASTCGFASLLGHCYSPFVRFNGGKGVATGFGVFLALAPVAALVAILGFIASFRVTRIVSLSSLTGAGAFLTLICFGLPRQYHPSVWLFGVLSALLIVLRHKENIRRLIAGTESPLSEKPTRAS
ncbi:MAG: glycerol-3-phosphate 1-O-acyltransferase PlsY [Deltaproteobacteria bacterium]|nr:glycerol-3-phosphate 1-O-acyltransferase PlsY [Deltaproteobacteria bacterium]